MTKYRIFLLHDGKRKAFCGFGGRFWFAELPSAAVIEYHSWLSAAQAVENMPDRFDRYAIFVEPSEDLPSGVLLQLPKDYPLFVD